MTRARFIPYDWLEYASLSEGWNGTRVAIYRAGHFPSPRAETTEFQIVASSHDAPGVTPNTVSGAKLSGKTGRGEVPKAAQHPRGVATASPKTVSGSLRVGGEQANNNAAPHNFNTQRN